MSPANHNTVWYGIIWLGTWKYSAQKGVHQNNKEKGKTNPRCILIISVFKFVQCDCACVCAVQCYIKPTVIFIPGCAHGIITKTHGIFSFSLCDLLYKHVTYRGILYNVQIAGQQTHRLFKLQRINTIGNEFHSPPQEGHRDHFDIFKRWRSLKGDCRFFFTYSAFLSSFIILAMYVAIHCTTDSSFLMKATVYSEYFLLRQKTLKAVTHNPKLYFWLPDNRILT